MSQSQDFYPVVARTEGQKRLVESIRSNQVTLCSAPAGSGKSLIALYEAIMLQKQQLCRDVIYTRPLVQFEALQGVGFLPGAATAQEKLKPIMYPVLDNLQVFCSAGFMKYIVDKQKIEPMVCQDLRGRSLNDTVLIVDEAASMIPKDVEMCLTRIGERSKIIMLADVRQKDTQARFKDGFSDAFSRLKGLDGVGLVQMTYADVVRGDGLCGAIQQRYCN
jgi:phosphate starvation-inducible protein PhoH and related proteins